MTSNDVIMVDAYQDITIPFQMSSTEFFTMVREHLNPGGVMVVNMNMISDGQRFDQRGVERYHRQRVRQWEHTDGRRAEHHEP